MSFRVRRRLIAVLALGGLVVGVSSIAGAAGPDRKVAGSLNATNETLGANQFSEAGTARVRVLPGPELAGPYTLDYVRLPGPTSDPADDVATGEFSFTSRGATLTGQISNTNYATCVKEPDALLCMDVVIAPLTVTGHGPLGRFEGGALLLQRNIFGETVVRTVAGNLDGTFCGTLPTC